MTAATMKHDSETSEVCFQPVYEAFLKERCARGTMRCLRDPSRGPRRRSLTPVRHGSHRTTTETDSA